MAYVQMGNILSFSYNNGVCLEPGAADASPDELHNAVKAAFGHMKDQFLVELGYDNWPPLAHLSKISYDEYLEAMREFEFRHSAKDAKRLQTRIRRAYFDSIRGQLILKMIEAGVPYVCAISGCGLHQELTVDHILPLSRGGTDDLSNLQFLCLPHNSAKGDKVQILDATDQAINSPIVHT